MYIDGKIITMKNDVVKIKQFMTGDVYKCEKSKVKIKTKDGSPDLSYGYYIGKVDFEYARLVRFGGQPKSVDYTK